MGFAKFAAHLSADVASVETVGGTAGLAYSIVGSLSSGPAQGKTRLGAARLVVQTRRR